MILKLFGRVSILGILPMWSLTLSNVTARVKAGVLGIMILAVFTGACDANDVVEGHALENIWHAL